MTRLCSRSMYTSTTSIYPHCLLRFVAALSATSAHVPSQPCSSQSLCSTSSHFFRKKCCCRAQGTSSSASSPLRPPFPPTGTHAGDTSHTLISLVSWGGWGAIASHRPRFISSLFTVSCFPSSLPTASCSCFPASPPPHLTPDGGHLSSEGHVVVRVGRGTRACGPTRARRAVTPLVARTYHAIRSVSRCSAPLRCCFRRPAEPEGQGRFQNRRPPRRLTPMSLILPFWPT